MERQRVLVTGASGFIGTNLIKYLLKEGYQVIALDRKKPEGYYLGYGCGFDLEDSRRETELQLQRIKGDIRDYGLLQKIFCRKIDYVIHLAALSTIQMGARDCEETISVNVEGTEKLLQATKENGQVKGFLYASTDKVYGKLKGEAYTEEDSLEPIDSLYDRSKAQADEMVCRWSKEWGIHGIILRFCNIYGKYDLQKTRIIPGTIQAIREKRECVLRVYRDEEGQIRNFRRDFLYVDDLCEIIGKIIDKLEVWNREGTDSDVWGQAFNLGSGHCYPMDKVIEIIRQVAGDGSLLKMEFSKSPVEIPKQRMDYTKAHEFFGFVPKTSLEEGIALTMDWWKKFQG